MLQTPISDEEIRQAKEMLSRGLGLSHVAAELGRHKRTIQSKLRGERLTSEERDRQNTLRREAKRALKEARGERREFFVSADGVGTAGNAGAPRPTAEMIAERDRRRSRPFSIAHDILGEPEPGRSALDQRAGAFA